MERSKQKSRKDKPTKYVDKETPSSSKTDVKTFKENLKIREILRTVKMNRSMRIKAPRGSKVMQNDFSENEDIFENTVIVEGQERQEQPSATNTILNTDVETNVVSDEDTIEIKCFSNLNVEKTEEKDINEIDIDKISIDKSKSLSEGIEEFGEYNDASHSPYNIPTLLQCPGAKSRDRKLSLDHTMLSRREGLSQSEADLHSIGKSPLERKSSFFKKKMDSFFKNTSEIFKRQSLGSKSIPPSSVERRGSTCSRMSVSLQSLNEHSAQSEECDNEHIDKYQEHQGSMASLRSVTTARSSSSVSVNVSDRPADMSEEESLADSRLGLVGCQPLSDTPDHIPDFNESYIKDSLLNTRAISMSSGLDSASNRRRRNPSTASRFNRVTWLASESLTDYFRSLIQDGNSEESQRNHSNQDSVPSNKHLPRTDFKGRRLSYVRAVSGEDPSLSRSQDSSLRRKNISENEDLVTHPEIVQLLNELYNASVPPPISGYTAWKICAEASVFFDLLDREGTFNNFFDFVVDENEADRFEIIKEIVYTESQHIRHLKFYAQTHVAAAHILQKNGFLVDFRTSSLFLNIPDILNANLRFWERAIFPMLKDAKENTRPFNCSLMMQGFYEFAEIFDPYELYMQNQMGAVRYLRKQSSDPEFLTYRAWCDFQSDVGFEFNDMIVKPMQRITKYTLMLERLRQSCSEKQEFEKEREVLKAEQCVKSHITAINRSCRQKDEMDILDNMKIEPYEPDFKGDDDMQKAYKDVSAFNLHMPMLDCAPHMMRCLVHQGDLRFKDNLKEFDARILLFTDMMLICKKMSKTPKNACHWKLQRPKVMLHRVVPSIKSSKSNEVTALIFVILDEHGSAKGVFKLWDVSKESAKNLKIWEGKVYEAMMSYALTKWYHKYPVKDLSIVEKDYNDETYRKEHPDICSIEKKARVRVAATLFPNKHLTYPEAVLEIEIPQTDSERESGPIQLHTVCQSGLQHFNSWQARGPNFQQRKITIFSFCFSRFVKSQTPSQAQSENQCCFATDKGAKQQKAETVPIDSPTTAQTYWQPVPIFSPNPYSEKYLRSLSLSSYEEGYFPLQRSGSSVGHYTPPLFFEDHYPSPSITVDVVGNNEDQGSSQTVPPTLVLQQSSPNQSPGPRSASADAGGSENTLRVASPSYSMVHSLPDINAEFYHVFDTPAAIPQTASEKLYRSHQELLQRNRLTASQNYLSPGNRGISYPPPSPTRPLKRGLAFSYSIHSNTPTLTRSKNVIAQSVQAELQKLSEVPRKFWRRKSPVSRQRSPSPSPSTGRPELVMPSTSSDKTQTTKSLFQRRSQDSTKSVSPERVRGETSDDTDYDADDDRSRRSSKSNKGIKIKHKETCILEDDNIEDQTENLAKAGKSLKKNTDKG